ncbi:MAG: bifunctional 4-hydroxy-2-oxoglutarate aldolase/2-dehydro-3-deoxy-phosphogluconate aldolase [Woeseiaceae bacterium]|nr:bifunctional 4-hydroxy-2-oxoglutarate aldolase/2-dehydro-3-deoxy-phosphogluconate aldolase [Woeseiaceae bacterium]
MTAAELLDGTRIVPVVVIDDPDAAVPLARTLLGAGLGAIEVTLRTPDAPAAIRNIASEVPEILIGAGSLRTPRQVEDVCGAGATFGVSPGSSPRLLDAVEAADLTFVPGAITPSESLALLDRGYDLQKLFPASIAGGVAYLKALGSPLPEVKFMPTGGINPDNAADYLALGNVACIGGSWVAPRNLLADGDFDAIRNIAVAAASLAHGD